MKIGVLEWNIAALGGRQRTMLAFADFFIELGHEVTFFSNFLEERPSFSRHTFLDWFHFKHLTYRHFCFFDLLRRYRDAAPEELHGQDVLLVPYGGYGHLQALLPNTRVITWTIHPDQGRWPEVTEIWTNTETTRQRLINSENWADSNPIVIYPPHDYSLFRDAANPWTDRQWDVAIVGSLLRAKGLTKASQMIEKFGLNGVLIGATWIAARDENEEIAEELRRGTCDLYLNIPSVEVATILGDTRCLLCTSEAESAPLIFYEALNAGCRIFSLDVGAAREQIGSEGYGYVQPDLDGLEGALKEHWNEPPVDAKRGWLFDRHGPCVGRAIKEALQ